MRITSGICKVKNFDVNVPINGIRRHIPCLCTVSPKITSDLSDLIRKMLKELRKKPFLNSKLEPRKFFGLESYAKMAIERTEVLLTYFKKFELESLEVGKKHGNIVDNYSNIVDLFKELKSDFGCAKITFLDKRFDFIHTLGFVRNGRILYILDSLGHNKNVSKSILRFHNNLKTNIFFKGSENGLEKIIMNQNTQQPMNELTCNHWSLANIEALIKNLKAGKKINNQEELDSVLPTDINKILDEHKKFVLSRHLIYSAK